MEKKALSVILASAMVLSMTACGGGKATETTAAATEAAKTEAAAEAAAPEAAPAEVGESYTVGICQLMQHVALDAATQGFKDALTEELKQEVLTLTKRYGRFNWASVEE